LKFGYYSDNILSMASFAMRDMSEIQPENQRFHPLAEITIQVFIVASVALYILEVDVGLSTDSLTGDPFWLWSERVIAGIFTVEFLMRWKIVGERYIFSVVGVIDFIAILPFWIGFIVPMEWLGIIRTLRVLRLLKWYRYSLSVRTFMQALYYSKRYLIGMVLIVIILTLFSAVGIHELEKDAQPEQFGSLTDSLWWTTVTLMTVGYGDSTPATVGGKLFAQFVMLVGVALTAAFIGIVGSSVYVRMQEMEAEEETDEIEITSQSGSDTAPDSSGDSA
jgi:voltage-gated potassium channel